jgi:hypothetical protein
MEDDPDPPASDREHWPEEVRTRCRPDDHEEDVHDHVREDVGLELGLLPEALHGLLTERRLWILGCFHFVTSLTEGSRLPVG